MPDATALPPEPAGAAPSGDARKARVRPLAESQAEALGELTRIGLKIAQAIERQVDAIEDGPSALPALNAAAVAFARAARAVRQTVLLQNRLLEAPGAAAAAAGGDVKGGVARIVRRAIEAEFGGEAEIERLTAEAAERLEQEFCEGLPARPVGSIVADVCKALGLAPDWRGLAADIAAAEALAGGDGGEAAELEQDAACQVYWGDEDGRLHPAPRTPTPA